MTPCLVRTKYHTTFKIFRHQCELWVCAMCVCIHRVIHLLVYSQVCEENWWIGTVWLHILHGVPLVDTELVGWDPALVVADPGQKQAAWVVVMAASHLACFVERLEGWPEADSERWGVTVERLYRGQKDRNTLWKTEVKFGQNMTSWEQNNLNSGEALTIGTEQ